MDFEVSDIKGQSWAKSGHKAMQKRDRETTLSRDRQQTITGIGTEGRAVRIMERMDKFQRGQYTEGSGVVQ